MPQRFTLELDRHFRRTYRLNILSIKFRLLMHVMSNPGYSIKDVHAESGLSYRGFHMKLREMLEAKLLILDDDPFDGRRKRVNIGSGGLMATQYFTAADSRVSYVDFAGPERDAHNIGE